MMHDISKKPLQQLTGSQQNTAAASTLTTISSRTTTSGWTDTPHGGSGNNGPQRRGRMTEIFKGIKNAE
jgi:Spy/CpxP family protein refolding chaperone